MSKEASAKDYGAEGIDIQTAMVRHVKGHPDRLTRSKYIIWNGRPLWTSYDLPVPKEGRFRLELLSKPRESPQGVDIKAEQGEIYLSGDERVRILRTWNDPRYEEVVEYAFKSEAGLLKVWNVYQHSWPDGRVTDERWTGNAGMLVDEEHGPRWLFQCSDGPSEPPNFNQLVFRISLIGD